MPQHTENTHAGHAYNEAEILHWIDQSFHTRNPLGDPLYDDSLAIQIIGYACACEQARANLEGRAPASQHQVAEACTQALIATFYIPERAS